MLLKLDPGVFITPGFDNDAWRQKVIFTTRYQNNIVSHSLSVVYFTWANKVRYTTLKENVFFRLRPGKHIKNPITLIGHIGKVLRNLAKGKLMRGLGGFIHNGSRNLGSLRLLHWTNDLP